MNKASCLSLLSNAVLVWSTMAIMKIITQLRAAGDTVADEDLARTSPLMYQHVIPNGTYHFARSKRGDDIAWNPQSYIFARAAAPTTETEADKIMADQSYQSHGLPVELQMWRLLLGSKTTQAIAVAAKLGVADLVAAAPRTVDQLAQETKTHAPSLHRLLQFLTSLGIFAEDADGKYRQTTVSETLRRERYAPRWSWSLSSNGDPEEIYGRQLLLGSLRSSASTA
jgi:Tn3 transposase DDE domain/Dimerisation domain